MRLGFVVLLSFLSVPHGKIGRLALALTVCLLSPAAEWLRAEAAELVGVTAGLRGGVIRTASFSPQAAIGQISSGQSLYLGDDIEVGPRGRLQVMLLDETVFTLGANTRMRIDEFVYDPRQAQTAKLTGTIERGTFRFVSGKVAQFGNDRMKVRLPNATIGVRGTALAGEVAPGGAANLVLLGPEAGNALGLPPGAVQISNAYGAVDLTRPGFATTIDPTAGQVPPSTPQRASPEQIERLERALQEEASAEIAAALGVDVAALNITPGQDTDGDGEADSFAANPVLAAALAGATAGGGTSRDAGLRAGVALTLFGEGILTMSEDERAAFFNGVNLGGGLASLIDTGNFDYRGITQYAELAELTGTTVFFADNAAIENSGGDIVGRFDTEMSWNFSTRAVASSLTGNFDLGNGTAGQFIHDDARSYQGAQGNAGFSYQTMFTPDYGAATQVTFGGNATTEPLFFHDGSLPGDDARRLTDLGPIASMSNPPSDMAVEISFNGDLSNVDLKNGTVPIGNLATSGVEIRTFTPDALQSDNPTPSMTARGFVFGMQTRDTQGGN